MSISSMADLHRPRCDRGAARSMTCRDLCAAEEPPEPRALPPGPQPPLQAQQHTTLTQPLPQGFPHSLPLEELTGVSFSHNPTLSTSAPQRGEGQEGSLCQGGVWCDRLPRLERLAHRAECGGIQLPHELADIL